MKRWVKPRTEVQVFEANEYVAACWAIACTYGIQGGEAGINNPNMAWREGTGATHTLRSDGTGCGHEDNQYITENDNGSFSVMEINTSGLGNLNTRLTKNSNYFWLSSSISDVEPGDTIYWTTSSGNRTWYHMGTVSTADYGHPNRS